MVESQLQDGTLWIVIDNGDKTKELIRVGSFAKRDSSITQDEWLHMVTKGFLQGRRNKLNEIKDAMSHDDES